MGYIPPGAKWYIADIVEEFTIEGEPDNVVHINTTLIHADSPDEAYEKAISLGRESEDRYKNRFGKQVTVRYRGLSNLNVVDGELEHGTELLFDRKAGVSEEELGKLILPKTELNVFRSIRSYVDDDEAQDADVRT